MKRNGEVSEVGFVTEEPKSGCESGFGGDVRVTATRSVRRETWPRRS